VRQRTGVTLVELLVVIAIIAVMTTLSSVALRRIDAPASASAADQVLSLRREAIAAGRPITRVLRSDSVLHVVSVLADGRVLADSALRLNPSTGIGDVAPR
jgi:prepilin-type N-terminal cleavage/methylation domain-containing protein